MAVAALAGGACAGLPEPDGYGGVRRESMLQPTAAPAAARAPAERVPAAALLQPDSDLVAAADVGATERQLRHELAHAADPTAAALELADLLCALERHRDALDAIDAALARRDAPALRVCRAGVLRDLARRPEAVAELQALARQHGAASLHPGLLFECAELQWLLGDAAAAQATLAELQRVHAADPWVEANATALRGLADELATASAPPVARVRDLLASLRGGVSPADRVRLLTELCRLADRETGPRREYLRSRAIAIACADESPAVRARAVQLAEVRGEDAADFCRTALADDAALVRQVAAERCPALAGDDAVPWLLAALAAETDGFAFAAMHAALAVLVPGGPELPSGLAGDAATRSAVTAAWRQRCRP
ncbi:MAG: hypothetical protein JNL08_15960 [Planctomycetes bacterium]|nr:hypothetical protein [Planctomycetota bacterium]